MNEARPKVLLMIPHLGGGGAERVMELLARHLSAERFEVHLAVVTESHQNKAVLSSLPGTLIVHQLRAARVRMSWRQIIRLVWKVRPHVILSGMAHLNFLVLLLRPLFPASSKVIVRQNTTVSSVLADKRRSRFTRRLYQQLYPKADRIVCQSQAMAEDLCSALGISLEKIRVLNNPVEVRPLTTKPAASPNERMFVAVGRLAREKGFDLLLEAFALLLASDAALGHGLKLRIAGGGPEEENLRTVAQQLMIGKVVEFVGHVTNPYESADIFVLSSRLEGMPNALLEAAALGLPIVAMPSNEGVIALLSQQTGVCLAERVSIEALMVALGEAIQQFKPGQRFEHAFVRPFELKTAIAAYEAMLVEELG